MATIKVSDLATKVGMPHQDLVFKLRSLGVRIESEEDSIDTDIIQALLTGKTMHQPREVILRDEAAAATAPAPSRRPPSRRVPPNQHRPPRRRTIIQRVEPRIRTIPSKDKPTLTPEEAARAEVLAAEAAAQTAAAQAPAAAGEAAPAEATAPQQAAATEVAGAATRATAPRIPTRAPVDPNATRRRRRKERKDGGEEEAEARDDAPVTITEGMTVRDFADKLGVKAKDIMQTLIAQGAMASINSVLDADTAEKLAAEHGLETMQVTFEEEVQLQEELSQPDRSGHLEPRAPIITVMGHIDHGKTSLLDAIRQTRVAESESGGITQHIGAYKVEVDGRDLVFLDTPGHEAFTKLRARGTQVTDIVILMVAADDGVMPQTVEAIDHAKAAAVPIVIAINKIDKANANLDKVKKDLSDHGIMVEEWGGDVVAVPMSALKGEGITETVEILALTADILDLKADRGVAAQGAILEARKDVGRGNLATVLVQSGTKTVARFPRNRLGPERNPTRWRHLRRRLHLGAMQDDRGQRIKEAGPATPIEVTGFGDLPNAGDSLQVVENESKARSVADFRRTAARRRELAPTHGSLSLEQLFERIQEGSVEELPIILKADVQGSLEVLRDAMADISTEKVKVSVIHGSVGAITTNDVTFAVASSAIVVGFNVRPERAASDMASAEGVDIRTHTVIYQLLDELKLAMTGLLKPTLRDVDRGRAEVRETFKVPRIGTVAGCHVVEGIIPRSAEVRLLRDNVVVYEGKISSLRRFKDDASEVRSGFDCGIGLERYQDVKPGDFIEAFEKEEVAATL